MSARIRYRCNACGETFDHSSIAEESPIVCPACQSHDLLHVPGSKPLDDLVDRLGESVLLKVGKAVLLIIVVFFSLIVLLGVVCALG